MNTNWTAQTPGVIKCAHCDYVYPDYNGSGMWFQSADLSAKTNYDAIIEHCRAAHREFYKLKWETEIRPVGPSFSAGWEPLS